MPPDSRWHFSLTRPWFYRWTALLRGGARLRGRSASRVPDGGRRCLRALRDRQILPIRPPACHMRSARPARGLPASGRVKSTGQGSDYLGRGDDRNDWIASGLWCGVGRTASSRSASATNPPRERAERLLHVPPGTFKIRAQHTATFRGRAVLAGPQPYHVLATTPGHGLSPTCALAHHSPCPVSRLTAKQGAMFRYNPVVADYTSPFSRSVSVAAGTALP